MKHRPVIGRATKISQVFEARNNKRSKLAFDPHASPHTLYNSLPSLIFWPLWLLKSLLCCMGGLLTAQTGSTPCGSDLPQESDRSNTEEVSKISQLSGLQKLPVELLLQVKKSLSSLDEHAVFSQICRKTSCLYTDEEFRHLCIQANVGRPSIISQSSWNTVAGESFNEGFSPAGLRC